MSIKDKIEEAIYSTWLEPGKFVIVVTERTFADLIREVEDRLIIRGNPIDPGPTSPWVFCGVEVCRLDTVLDGEGFMLLERSSYLKLRRIVRQGILNIGPRWT